MNPIFAIAIHGGAGTIKKEFLNTEMQEGYELALKEALDAGYAILENKGSAIDAVSAAVVSLENCPLFNAGKGSVFNHEGKHEMDASIMNGNDLSAGAVSGVTNIKNPVRLAKEILQNSEHVFLSGEGASMFAKEQALEFESDAYFYDEHRYMQLQTALKEDKIFLDHAQHGDRKFSTVGAVALDIHGDLAAATSTGGMTNKKFGRVGDTPIIGAGTYANNQTAAISCTGHGEYFIRKVVAHQVHCLMEYKKISLKEAAELVIMKELVNIGGEGGLIAIDKAGNYALPFNSEGMYRGFKNNKGENFIAIHQ